MVYKRRRQRQGRFEQSLPLALGHITGVRPQARSSIWVPVGLILAVIAGLALWIALSPRFYVLNAEVVGNSRIPAGEVLAASGLERLHILWVDEREAEARILARLPSLREARVSCRLPARCTIAVVERDPLVAWDTGERLVWVDAAGGAFPASRPLEGRWLVVGPLPTDENGLVDREVLVGLAELERLGFAPGRIGYRPGRGLVLDDPAGWRVILGQGSGMERRLQVYALVRKHLLDRGVHPRFVDVRFPDAPYYSEVNEW